MPMSCVVGGCTRNATKNQDIYWLSFPQTKAIRRQWIRFVNTTRSDFQISDYSKICSYHFEDDCLDQSYKLKINLGLQARFKLKEGAIPTVKSPTLSGSVATSTAVSSEADGEPCRDKAGFAGVDRPSTAGHANTFRGRRSGGAFQKREKARILEEVERDFCQNAEPEPTGANLEEVQDTCEDASTQTRCMKLSIQLDVVKVDVYPQCPTKTVFVRSRRSQTDPRMFPIRHKGVQAVRRRPSKKVQCELIKAPKKLPVSSSDILLDDMMEVESDEEISSSEEYQVSSKPSSDSDLDLESDEDPNGDDGPLEEKKYLVFEHRLLQLFTRCSKCAGPSKRQLHRPYGGMLVEVIQTCQIRSCSHIRKWQSQPMVGNVAAGNILMSASILISGVCISKFIHALTSMNIAMISSRTFYNHQKSFLQPAIVEIWHKEQESILSTLQASNTKAFLGMDMRADSMGHSAKYGSYSVVELNQGKVLHVELVQKSDTGNKSNLMELEGLVRTMRWLDSQGVDVDTIVTDRHKQVTKYIREKLGPRGIKHFYDIWHVAKGLKKKLTAVSRKPGCGDIQNWIQGIVNNLYWVAASTPDGDGDLMLAKFSSIVNHILGIHHHDSKLFPLCAHGHLEDRKWLNPGSQPAEKLQDILNATYVRKDVKKLSPSMQTSSVEAFHSVIIHYAPKMLAFSFEGMWCRIYLAALHFNENSGRQQALDRQGNPAFTINFPRAKQTTGGYSVRKVPVQTTYDFNHRIFSKVLELCSGKMKDTRSQYRELTSNPGFVCAKFDRPNKEEAVAKFISRFSKVQHVGRPEGCADVTVPERVIFANEKKKKKKKKKKSKKDETKKSKPTKRKPNVEDQSGPSSSKPGKKHRKK